MKKRFILVCLALAFLLALASLAAQTIPDSETYGKVLICDDFESYADGTDIYGGGSGRVPAYVSSTFPGTPRFATDGHLHVVKTIGSNNWLKIGKKSAGQQWPQIVLYYGKKEIELWKRPC